jgi:hypothetical protein
METFKFQEENTMYNSNQTVTVTLLIDEAVAILRNRDSRWTVVQHLEGAEEKSQQAVTEKTNQHYSVAVHEYAIKHT